MAGIDESRSFIPVHIALLTVSDSRSLETDLSGAILAERLLDAGHILADRALVRDDGGAIQTKLTSWIADRSVDVVIATGGTGVTGRDVTPEAFEALYEKAIPGFGELFRWISFKSIGTSTMQSRATAGVANGTYLFAVPGSSNACRQAWDEILRFQLDSRYRPCNLVDLMPRLNEHRLS